MSLNRLSKRERRMRFHSIILINGLRLAQCQVPVFREQANAAI